MPCQPSANSRDAESSISLWPSTTTVSGTPSGKTVVERTGRYASHAGSPPPREILRGKRPCCQQQQRLQAWRRCGSAHRGNSLVSRMLKRLRRKCRVLRRLRTTEVQSVFARTHCADPVRIDCAECARIHGEADVLFGVRCQRGALKADECKLRRAGSCGRRQVEFADGIAGRSRDILHVRFDNQWRSCVERLRGELTDWST